MDANERAKLTEEIVEELIDALDGEPFGGDQMDHLLHRYGYRPTKGVKESDVPYTEEERIENMASAAESVGFPHLADALRQTKEKM